MFRFKISELRTLLIVLILWSPGFAWSRSERPAYRELERVRLQWKREAERIDKLRRGRSCAGKRFPPSSIF